MIELIPTGKQNAIPRKRLCELSGLDDRTVRQIIAKESHTMPIINLQDGEGYFMPSLEEKSLVERYYKQEMHRIESRLYSLEGVQKWLDIEGKVELRRNPTYEREYHVTPSTISGTWKLGTCQCGVMVSNYQKFCSDCGTRIYFR